MIKLRYHNNPILVCRFLKKLGLILIQYTYLDHVQMAQFQMKMV